MHFAAAAVQSSRAHQSYTEHDKDVDTSAGRLQCWHTPLIFDMRADSPVVERRSVIRHSSNSPKDKIKLT